MLPRLLLAMVSLLLGGCASIMSSATGQLADNLSDGVLNQNDVATVKEGGPAYLLLIDGLIGGDPDNQDLLRAGARLYTAYGATFVDDPERARRLTERGREYGLRAVCERGLTLCTAAAADFDTYTAALAEITAEDLPAFFDMSAAWAAWLQVSSSDWRAIADLPKVTAAMERAVELDEEYADGAGHLYLGVLATQLPASLGGKPEEGRSHFERADEIAGGRNLMVRVMYAENYARLVFNRELHDALLRSVLDADPRVPGLTLSNTLAQERAEELLASADEFF